MKVIRAVLDPKSIENAINELQQYKRDVEEKSRQLVQKLMELGADIAKIKIVELDAVDSAELLSSVDVYYSPLLNAGYVRVTSDHAAFVEFGTGVVGQASPHKNGEYLAKAGWAYAVGETIFTTKDGKTGWYFPLDDGTWRFTEGMASRPYMYETALELQRKFPKIVKAVFRT